MNWKFWQKKGKPFLVLDVGTEAIKSIIVEKIGGRTKILSYSLTYLQDSYPDSLKKDLTKNLDEVYGNFALFSGSKRVVRDSKDLPVFLLPPPESFRAEVVECGLERSHSESRISKEEKEIIQAQAFEQTKFKIITRFSENSGILPTDVEWLDLKIISGRIDGYEVEDVRGYKGLKLDFKVLAVFTPKLYLDNINKTLADLGISVRKIYHLSQVILSGVLSSAGNGIFLDVGGKMTQVFCIKDGKLDAFEVFERGGWDFSEKLFDILNVDKASIRQMKEDYANNRLTPEVEERIKDVFATEKIAWKKRFAELRKAEFQGMSVFFFGGGALLKEIRSIFRKRKIVFPSNLESVSLPRKEVAKMSQFVPCFLVTLIKLKNGKKNI